MKTEINDLITAFTPLAEKRDISLNEFCEMFLRRSPEGYQSHNWVDVKDAVANVADKHGMSIEEFAEMVREMYENPRKN
jgi:hypothetical protein